MCSVLLYGCDITSFKDFVMGAGRIDAITTS